MQTLGQACSAVQGNHYTPLPFLSQGLSLLVEQLPYLPGTDRASKSPSPQHTRKKLPVCCDPHLEPSAGLPVPVNRACLPPYLHTCLPFLPFLPFLPLLAFLLWLCAIARPFPLSPPSPQSTGYITQAPPARLPQERINHSHSTTLL